MSAPADNRRGPPPQWIPLAQRDHDLIITGRPGMAPALLRAWSELLFEARRKHSTTFTLPTDVCAQRFDCCQRHAYRLLHELQALELLTVATTRVGGRYTPLVITIRPTVDLFSRRTSIADGKGSHRRTSKGGVSKSESNNTGTTQGVNTHTPGGIPPGRQTADSAEVALGAPLAAASGPAEQKEPLAIATSATPWVGGRLGGGQL